MGTFLQFAVLGCGLAAAYIGLSVGMIATYRATGIINFAQGAMAVTGAYVFASVSNDGVLPLPVGSIDLGSPPDPAAAMSVALICAAGVGLASHALAFRWVRYAPTLAQVVVSIGVMLSLQAAITIRFGSDNVAIKEIIPNSRLQWGDLDLPTRELVMVAVMTAISAILWVLQHRTKLGVAARAAAQNEEGVLIRGYSPQLLAGMSLSLGTVISTAGVILAGSITGLNPSNYTLLVVPALAVVLVARMTSIPVAVLASILLGVFQSSVNLLTIKPWWPLWAKSGLDQVVPFMVVAVMLFFLAKRLPARGSLDTTSLPDVHVPRANPRLTVAVITACGVLLWATSGSLRFSLTYSMIIALMALSYVVVTGYLGQISLAQTAFAGAAGFLLSKLTTDVGLPFWFSFPVCSLATALLGIVVAIPAIRIRGAQLAVITIAAALAIERFVFNNYSLTPPEGNPIAEPTLFGLSLAVRTGDELSRLEFSLFVLVVVSTLFCLFRRIAAGDTGRTFLAVRANERAAASAGIDVRGVKLMGFAISAFLAGAAGCLMGYSTGQLSAESFSVFVGLQILAVAYMGGITSMGGAMIAGILGPLGLVYTLLHTRLELGDYYMLASGVALILTAILNPVGIAGQLRMQVGHITRKAGFTT